MSIYSIYHLVPFGDCLIPTFEVLREFGDCVKLLTTFGDVLVAEGFAREVLVGEILLGENDWLF